MSSLPGLAEEHLGGVDKGVGELTVLHELTDMAIEGSANRRELGKMNVPPAGLDPVIGQPRHPEDGGRCFLGKPERAATPPQSGSNAGLCVADIDSIGRCCGVGLNSRAPMAAPERTTFDRYSAARTPRKVAIDRGLLNRFCEKTTGLPRNVKGGIQFELVIKDNSNCQYI